MLLLLLESVQLYMFVDRLKHILDLILISTSIYCFVNEESGIESGTLFIGGKLEKQFLGLLGQI